MTSPSPDTSTIAATIGDVHGSQIAIGDHILQVNARDGARVKVVTPRKRVRPRSRPGPVLMRPRAVTGFVNREAEAGAVLTTLRASGAVEIVGVGGIGKTALLRQVCNAPLEGHFPDGIIHMVAAGRPAEDLLQLIFGFFYEAPGRYKPTEPELRHALVEKRAVIVLDDVDHAVDELTAVVDALPLCAVLVATETRRWWGESELVPLAGLSPEHAIVLIERELGRTLVPEERAAAEALSLRLEGHPLKVLQAAAQVRQAGRTLQEVPGESAAPAPLNERERSVLLAIVAAGGLELSALVDLVGGPAVERPLESLIDRRLVEAQEGVFRGTAAAAGLFDDRELADARSRVLAYLVTWTEARRNDPDAVGARAPLLLRTIRGALAAGEAAAALRLARAAEVAFMLLGLWGSWRSILAACTDAGRLLADDRSVEAWVLHQLGTIDLVTGDTVNATARLERALRIRESLGDVTGAATSRANLQVMQGAPGFLDRIRDLAPSHPGGALAGIVVVAGGALLWQFGFFTPLARVNASPAAVDFGQQGVGDASVVRDIRITNESRGLVRMDPAVIEGDHFRITADGCAGDLPGETSCDIAAVFVPSAPGYRTARLRVSADGARTLPPVTLAGYGIDAPVSDTVPPPLPPTDTVAGALVVAQDVDFGVRAVGSVTIGTGVLNNRGETAVRFDRLELTGDGDFRLTSDACSGASLFIGQRCNVEIEFIPAVAGARSAAVTARGMDGDLLSVLRVRGGGTAPPPRPEPARILHFAFDTAALQARRELRLCYGVADATQVRIDPAPGRVEPLEKECVDVPPAPGVYTISVIGADGVRRSQQLTVALPGARILRFAADPATIEAGAAARLCYAIADATEAAITPQPDAGAVTTAAQNCVEVRPASTRTYTLRVVGLDGRATERQVAVTVSPISRPPVPQQLTPGTTSAANPHFPTTCPNVVASWVRVTDPARVEYEVLLQRRTGGGRWVDAQRASTRAATFEFRRPIEAAMRGGGEGTYAFRWSVRASAGENNVGDTAPMRYFSCIVIH